MKSSFFDTVRALEALKKGSDQRFWYRETENTLVDLFGRDRLPLVTRLLAATSINSSLKSNVALFFKAMYQIQNNLPTEGYLPVIQQSIERVRRGEELSGRKINAFSRAMSGDPSAVVVDIWLLRAFDRDRKYFRKGVQGYRSGGASKRDYDFIEDWCIRIAEDLGWEPREVSSSIWAGQRLEDTGDRLVRYCEIIKQEMNYTLFPLIN